MKLEAHGKIGLEATTALAICCCLLGSCAPESAMNEHSPILDESVRSFQDSYNAKDFGAIYQAASIIYKGETDLSAHTRTYRELFESCGQVVESRSSGQSEEPSGDGYMIVLSYRSRFERCAGVEYFTFLYYSRDGMTALVDHDVERE